MTRKIKTYATDLGRVTVPEDDRVALDSPGSDAPRAYASQDLKPGDLTIRGIVQDAQPNGVVTAITFEDGHTERVPVDLLVSVYN